MASAHLSLPQLIMPAISPPAKVLVTGASGYIAIHVVKALIDRGYFVRGTVRSDKKGEYIRNLFGADKFEWIVVPDMEAVSPIERESNRLLIIASRQTRMMKP